MLVPSSTKRRGLVGRDRKRGMEDLVLTAKVDDGTEESGVNSLLYDDIDTKTNANKNFHFLDGTKFASYLVITFWLIFQTTEVKREIEIARYACLILPFNRKLSMFQ